MDPLKSSAREREFARVYDVLGNTLYRLSYSLLLSREEAKDVVQEVFLKYLRGHPPFSDDGHEKAWLLCITVNQCRDLLRRRKHRHHLPLGEADAFCADTGTGEVTRQLLLLPRLYQVPLLLHYYEGCSVKEIGSVLRLSASAVKMRLKRGREKLCDALLKEEESG
ncbi:MAG: RNA polymerase sigma factor [Oscillibacter sp.]|nr:RNA polymerase sigma factor [Oscillibacter sp.]